MSKSETSGVDATLTPAELDAMQMPASRELTDDELESVAGGKDVAVNNRRPGGRFPRRR